MQLRQYQLDLINGVSKSWREGFKAPCIVAPCGSGKSCMIAEIARRVTDKKKVVLFLVHRKELIDQIARTFIKWGVDIRFCDIMMIQTAVRRLEKIRKPDLIITDENHHSLAKTYRRVYDFFPEVYRVGATATPVRLNGDGLGDVNDKLVTGVTAKWLIENKYLAPYEYFAPYIADLTGIRTKRGEYVVEDVEKVMIKKAVFGNVIDYYKKLANKQKAICCCASIKHSRSMAEAFNDAGIAAKHIDGKTPKAERDDAIQKFRDNEIQILCNVDLISEGFDVPDCSCSILLRPTKSLTLYIQQSMRCMRYQPGKRAIIIDHVGNYARFGMPDDTREWTLEKKDKKAKEQEAKAGIRRCPACFMVFYPSPAEDKIICPFCGQVLESKRQELKQVEAELHKIAGFHLDARTPEDCKNYQELLEYAKWKKYKPGWAYYQAIERGFLVKK